MKKNYLLSSIASLLLCLYSFNIHSQAMTGVYTIDNTSPASASNFTSFTSFATYLNANGVSGPVTVNVSATSGPYNEQVNFTQAAGVSATNTITVNGNGRTLSFTSSSSTAPHTLLLSGADYMTFDNLVINGSGTTYALSVHLWNQANSNQFTNCKITTVLNGTSSSQIPLSMSGSSTSATTSGDHGNNNTVSTCTMSGGYYSTVMYGMTGSPYNTNNRILNCSINDFYSYGIYVYYDRNFIVKGNVIERLNQTTTTTVYGMSFNNQAPNSLVEGNHVRKLFQMLTTSSSGCYPIYCSSAGGTSGNEMIIRNNIISDIRSNGQLYGIYAINGSYYLIDHNTISLDDGLSTYSGQTIGVQYYCQYFKIRNNIISIKRGGTTNSTRVGINVGSPVYLTGFESRNNVFNIGGTPGANHIGYNSVYYSSLQAWQTGVNQDLTSYSTDPLFNNPTGGDYAPTSLTINNTAVPLGVTTDFYLAARSLVMPDPGAIEFYTVACTSSPGTVSIVAPSGSVCPGNTVNLVLGSNTFTNAGYTVQWYSSTVSPLGGYNSISGGTLNTQNSSPVNVNTYFNAVVTCVNSSQTTTTSVGSVLVAQTFTNAVPYYESFETIGYNSLPNCSWSNTQGNSWPISPTASFLQTNNRVPRTGNGYAIFTATTTTTNYFYSNGIWLEPNITYSASTWYINESVNYNPWADFSILLGTSQSPTGLVSIASSNGPAVSVLYSLVSNTFMVTSPAFYYVAIKATSATGSSPYLTWDDLSITIPCALNQPTLNITASADSICLGESVDLTASGAGSYTWSTGANSATITEAPNTSTVYVLNGTSTLTGCSSNVSKSVIVSPTPVISVVAFPVAVCAGAPVNLVAVGANVVSFVWSNTNIGPSTTVYPLINSTYTVSGTSLENCSATATIQVSAYALPVVIITTSVQTICRGETITLTGSGANTYNWTSQVSGSVFQGPIITDTPNATTIYSLTGTDANGCKGTAIQPVSVGACTGVNDQGALSGVKVYPNPFSDKIIVETNGNITRNITLTDITGRILMTAAFEAKTELSLGSLAGGIYYLKVASGEKAEIIKVVKN